MPSAVADTTKYERFDLKTLPEGFVTLRKLSYGEMLDRVDMAGKMAIDGSSKSKTPDAVIEMAQGAVQVYEFQKCIGEHNLEDADGKPLNLASASDIRRLDPQVGEEISRLIDKLTQLPDDAELGNS